MTKRGLDVGNYSLKEYPGTNIKSLVSSEENILGSKLHLEYEDKHYYIGEGNFETELNKSNKENFLPLLLTGIALNSNKNDVFQNLVVGLPINQYKTNHEALENLVLSNKVKEVKFNGEPRKIIIEEFKVYPEAIGAYYSLPNQDDVIIIDIGGRTTDICYIVDKKVKESSTTVVGTIGIYKDIVDKLNSLYSLDLDIFAAEKILSKGYFEIDGEHTDLSFVVDILKKNFNKINDELIMKFPCRTEKIVLVGGGYKLFEKAFKNRYVNSSVADNPIFANSIGFRKVADTLWI
ncbi:ParM/StbA family protein [Clostridium estertheticum]|uniref:ParM/StbA family protein n=1 Tax=Clostridium estertheticum TaxID=238834 RepID=UPI001C0CA845|nr:ParM/StbA family protein [Clostridium estertheticum]MBU3186624.1 ParM/StbA family protein [Clostridium estertheticum]